MRLALEQGHGIVAGRQVKQLNRRHARAVQVNRSLGIRLSIALDDKLALMARRTCRDRTVLGRVAAVVLVGHALDLYVQVGPPLMGGEPVLGFWELGPLVGALALFFLVVLGALGKGSAVPGRHPHLADSLAYETP